MLLFVWQPTRVQPVFLFGTARATDISSISYAVSMWAWREREGVGGKGEAGGGAAGGGGAREANSCGQRVQR